MLAPALALLLVWGGFAQDVSGTRDADEPLAALAKLIERSNALRSFRAEYAVEEPEDQRGTIELAYLAPDRMRIEVRRGADVEPEVRFVLRGDVLCMTGAVPGERPHFARVDLDAFGQEPPPALAALEWSFPTPRPPGLGAGPQLILQWKLDQETQKVDFTASILPTWRRSSVLGWFDDIQQEGALALEGLHLVQEHPRYQARLSLETGFLEELRLEGQEGQVFTMRLAKLELDPDLDPHFFALPEPQEGALDFRRRFLEVQLASESLPNVRRKLLRRIDRMLHAGHIRWSASVAGELERVLRVLHEPPIEAHAATREASVGSWIDSLCSWIEQRRSSGAPAESLRVLIAERRRGLAQTHLNNLASLLEWLDRQELLEPESSDWSDLLALERRVVEQLHATHVAGPTLERFDQATERALAD